MRIDDLRCNGLVNPLGLKDETVEFGWKLYSEIHDTKQSAWQIFVKETGTNEIVWDSGKVLSEQQFGIHYEGSSLCSNKLYEWSVITWDNKDGNAVSHTAFFSIGLKTCEWKAKWIGCQKKNLDSEEKMASKEEMVEAFLAMVSGKEQSFKPDRTLLPCFIYRRLINLNPGKKLKAAFLSITAHGLYDCKINGGDVTDAKLTPGFTAYDDYLEFQTYDVTRLLKEQKNVISVVLADGWYRGKFGILGYGNNYGTELAFLSQLDLQYEDGTNEIIGSDQAFKYDKSSYIYSDLLIGEKQDAGIDMEAYYQADFDDSTWCNADSKDYGYDNLQGISDEPVRCTEIRTPNAVILSPKGETIVDFGQVLVGVVRLQVVGERGTVIKLEHSEVLDKDGNFINNVSGFNRDQTDYFVLSGSGQEVFEPKFTVHGFRYVKITGCPVILEASQVHAIVLGSDLEETGSFECSDTRLNQLQSNIRWSQKGNMLSIPTDCPQRERAGWTGDILVYAKTAAFNQNVKQFLSKWLKNMEKEQFSDGLIPVVIPYPLGYNAMQKEAFGTDTSAGWGDAAVIVPWVIYQSYGDKRILEECFDMILRWMKYVEHDAASNMPELEGEITTEWRERQKYLWNTGFHFGDWCYPSCKNEKGQTDMFRSAYTTKLHVATAMYANSADIMSQICGVLGKHELQKYYKKLNIKIRDAFSEEYVRADGSIEGAVQGIYVLAIAMKMADETKLYKMADYLSQMIVTNGNKLDTGFLSIEYLMDVLTAYGHKEIACKLLYQDNCPSWLYEIKNGATTIWETWNAILEDGTPTDNSYNHYAFGCIGDWMYRNLLGLQLLEPGYKKFLFKPDLSFGLHWAKGTFKSAYGLVRCEWKLDGKQGEIHLEVPVGSSAIVEIGDWNKCVGSGRYTWNFETVSK
ncbi:MAG: family 78 glycoside hydrolase catalytic domain [Lachnospiraceae bacterium]